MNFPRALRKFAPGLIVIILLLAGLCIWTWITIPYGTFVAERFERADARWRFDLAREAYLVTPWGSQRQGYLSKERGEWFWNLNQMTAPAKGRLEISLMEVSAFKTEPLPATDFVLKRLFFTPTLPKPAKE